MSRSRFRSASLAASTLDAESRALVALGRALKARRYRFVAVTPETHACVVARRPEAATLADVFGWNLPFDPETLDPDLTSLLSAAGALVNDPGKHRGKAKSRVRFSSLGDLLFVHSAFPTTEHDAVFFGPDTYRFARALRASLAGMGRQSSLRLIDIGCGSGAGGIVAASLLGKPSELILADINPLALRYSAVNAILNDCPAVTVLSDVLDGIEGEADLLIANPPYLVDPEERLYRHGGGDLGFSLGLRIVEQGLERLRTGGRLILYSGVPILGGTDPFLQALRPLLQPYDGHFSYEEIDPDVFGAELDKDVYAAADRIAVVVLTVTKE